MRSTARVLSCVAGPVVSLVILWIGCSTAAGLINALPEQSGSRGRTGSGRSSGEAGERADSLWGVGNADGDLHRPAVRPGRALRAADLDGAEAWQKTKNVTVPLFAGHPLQSCERQHSCRSSAAVVMSEDGRHRARSILFDYLFDNAFSPQDGYASGWRDHVPSSFS